VTRPVIVQKFGGTSVATAEGRSSVLARVRAARESGSDVVVVVSAMGRAGSPYATDTLLGLLPDGPADDRERDMLASCGEIVAAVVFAHELRQAGIPAAAFTGADAGIVTDDRFSDARIVSLHPDRLVRALGDGLTPVVAGFQGCTADGETTTLGRGGSDTSACALGVALRAERVEIYTDVDGVMTADPRDCAEARILPAISYEELFQMAHHGAKVMHAPAAELAMDGGVTLRVRNTFSEAPGTLVADVSPPKGVATAVSHIDGIAQLRVSLPPAADEEDLAHMEAQTRVYRALADAGVSLDMFTPCTDRLVFTVAEGALADAMRVLDRLEVPYDVVPGLAKVTLVGAGMRGVPGVMARTAEALCAARVPILQTADSHTTISVLVWQNMRKAAVVALHQAFGLSGS
jgi:aspartate kinase